MLKRKRMPEKEKKKRALERALAKDTKKFRNISDMFKRSRKLIVALELF